MPMSLASMEGAKSTHNGVRRRYRGGNGAVVAIGFALLLAPQTPGQTIQTIAGAAAIGYRGPALQFPTNAVKDDNGVVYISDFRANQIVRLDAQSNGTVFAGTGTAASTGDGQQRLAASFNNPIALALDAAGDLFVAEYNGNRIRRIDAQSGVVTTVAGNGTAGFAGDGGPATSASLSQPHGMAFDIFGNLYIADQSNNRIRMVDAVAQNIITVAGTGQAGFAGDGAAANMAMVSSPYGVAVNPTGDLFIADEGNNRIRRVDGVSGMISTYAGNGTATYAGDGGAATSASLNGPYGVDVDAGGNVWIGDTFNSRVRYVDATTHIITTAAGSAKAGFAGDGGPPTAAQILFPYRAFPAYDNTVYIGQPDLGLLRAIVNPGNTPPYVFQPESAAYGPEGGSGTVKVHTLVAGPAWTSSASASWITINSSSTDPVNGFITYTVAANPVYTARTATLTAGNRKFYVAQRGKTCTFSTNAGAAGLSFTVSGGTTSLAIQAVDPSCAWTVSMPRAVWVSSNAVSGTGNGTVKITTIANLSSPTRQAVVIIAGQQITVTQGSALALDQFRITGRAVPQLAAVDTAVMSAMLDWDIPGGAVAVAYNGKLVFARGYGYADTTLLEPYQPDTLNRLASTSKYFTFESINRLIAAGKVTAATLAYAFLGYAPPPGGISDPRINDITVNDLINHEGGWNTALVGDIAFDNEVAAARAFGVPSPPSVDQFMRYNLGTPLQFAPGTSEAYSNFGYTLLARVIAQASGMNYQDYVRQTMLTPNGIIRTQIGGSLLADRLPGETLYYPRGGLENSVFDSMPGLVSEAYGGYALPLVDGAAGWVSSAIDLARLAPTDADPGAAGSLPEVTSYIYHSGSLLYTFVFNSRGRGDFDAVTGVGDALAGVTSWPTGDLFPLYTDSAPYCQFSVGGGTITADYTGGVFPIQLQGPAECGWTATPSVPWITVPVSSFGNGPGTVSVTLAANPSGTARSGSVHIGGLTVQVQQGGAPVPVITSINVSGGGPDIAQNAWIEIRGKNLIPAGVPLSGANWNTAPEFTSGRMPTQIGGYPLGITVNNKPAYISFFCNSLPGSICTTDQINVLTPLDNTLGQAPVVVTTAGLVGASFSVNLRAAAPAFPLVGATSYIVATHTDYSLVGPVSLSSPGYPFSPARPGETIVLYGFGFGLPKAALVAGSSTQVGPLPALPVVQIGGQSAVVSYAGVIQPGLYQLNVIVPNSAADGDNSVTCSYNGSSTTAAGLIAVQR